MCYSTPQELTRELVAEKLPTLYAHLTNNCVDIAVITFNWLLAAFVDALPTEVSEVIMILNHCEITQDNAPNL